MVYGGKEGLGRFGKVNKGNFPLLPLFFPLTPHILCPLSSPPYSYLPPNPSSPISCLPLLSHKPLSLSIPSSPYFSIPLSSTYHVDFTVLPIFQKAVTFDYIFDPLNIIVLPFFKYFFVAIYISNEKV